MDSDRSIGFDEIDVRNRDDYVVESDADIETVLRRLEDEYESIAEIYHGGDHTQWRHHACLASMLSPWLDSEWAHVDDAIEMVEGIRWKNADAEHKWRVEEVVDLRQNHTPDPEVEKPKDARPDDSTLEYVAEQEYDDAIDIEAKIRTRVLEHWKPRDYGIYPDDEEDFEVIDKKEAIHRTAVLFEQRWNYLFPDEDAAGWRETLYVYDEDEGVYVPKGADHSTTQAENLLEKHSTNHFENELVRKLERRNRASPKEIEENEPGPFRLAVGNGILDLREGELESYTADEYHKVSIDIDYDPDATCEGIDEFFHEVVNAQNVPTLYRLAAHMLVKTYISEKAAMFVGEGANGKSTVEELYRRFLGKQNVSSRGLRRLVNYKFAANNLRGKLANLEGDLSPQELNESRMFKKLTGGDEVTADIKSESSIDFRNHATLVFAVNEVPESPEDSEGWWRRWMYIQFPHQFKGDDAEPEEQILDRIASEDQLEGLLARAVEEIQRYDETGEFFPDSDSVDETREQMKNAANPVRDFVTVAFDAVEEPEESFGRVRKNVAVNAYDAYAEANNLPRMNSNKLKEEIQNLDDIDIDDGGRKRCLSEGDDREYCFEGVEWTARGRQLASLDEPDEDDPQDALDDEPATLDGGDVRLRDVREYVAENDDTDVYEVLRHFELGGDAFEVVEKLIGSVREDGDER